MGGITKPRVRVSIDFFDIAWDSVHCALSANFRHNDDEAAGVLRAFIRKLRSPVNAQWTGQRELSRDERLVALCLCELYGADVISIVLERVLAVPLLEPRYCAEIQLDPFASWGKQDGNGFAEGRYALSILGMTVNLKSVPQVLAFYAGVIIFGAFLYAVLIGFILYAVAVLLLFIADPEIITVVALRHPSAGLALLCLLVGLAGLSGKAWRNIVDVLRHRIPWKVPE